MEDGLLAPVGSDVDGAKIPAGVGNAAGLQNLVQVMRTRGYGEPLIEKLCHRNWLRAQQTLADDDFFLEGGAMKFIEKSAIITGEYWVRVY